MSASVMPQSTPADETAGDVGGASIQVRQRGDVLVIRPLGALDRRSLPRIRAAVLGAGHAAVLDLDGCVLVDPRMLAAADFAAGDGEAPEVHIVSGRLSCRRLLARVGATERHQVHRSIEEAIQAMGAGTSNVDVVVPATGGSH